MKGVCHYSMAMFLQGGHEVTTQSKARQNVRFSLLLEYLFHMGAYLLYNVICTWYGLKLDIVAELKNNILWGLVMDFRRSVFPWPPGILRLSHSHRVALRAQAGGQHLKLISYDWKFLYAEHSRNYSFSGLLKN